MYVPISFQFPTDKWTLKFNDLNATEDDHS